jgi:hypothetical protein
MVTVMYLTPNTVFYDGFKNKASPKWHSQLAERREPLTENEMERLKYID